MFSKFDRNIICSLSIYIVEIQQYIVLHSFAIFMYLYMYFTTSKMVNGIFTQVTQSQLQNKTEGYFRDKIFP